ncbi:restriction endonuclease fold toxin [Chromobacterium sp. LK1]|uniref:restriction endonuclease fold toxin n=1 Tax=Chromobacterium sp. LK1 TaxID=1628193 RepID=UPI0026F3B7DF|nr:restriction endonuclease fold toxin [Chromobacterium sp. LK1]
MDKPVDFLSKSTRNQIKATIDMANQQGKAAEFWFKYGARPKVRSYIETKGGVVRVEMGR